MDNQAQNTPIMHSFTQNKTEVKAGPMKVIVILFVVVLVGVGTGFALSRFAPSGAKGGLPLPQVGQGMQGKTFGSGDTKTFKDTAEGKLEAGGIDGEGQYHLVRPGGDSQNVYLTSSYVDLSQFVGKKIKVWGETQAAQKAGWLMDVGKVQVQ